MKPAVAGLSAWRGVTPGGHAGPCIHSQPNPCTGDRASEADKLFSVLTSTKSVGPRRDCGEGSLEGGLCSGPPRSLFKPCGWTAGPFPSRSATPSSPGG